MSREIADKQICNNDEFHSPFVRNPNWPTEMARHPAMASQAQKQNWEGMVLRYKESGLESSVNNIGTFVVKHMYEGL